MYSRYIYNILSYSAWDKDLGINQGLVIKKKSKTVFVIIELVTEESKRPKVALNELKLGL